MKLDLLDPYSVRAGGSVIAEKKMKMMKRVRKYTKPFFLVKFAVNASTFIMKQLKHLICLLTCWSSVSAVAQEKPNILVFFIDDMGLMDTSVPFALDEAGKPKVYPLNEYYHTPAMEKLAANGVRFSHFYANSVCSPSRVSLLKGQYSARHYTTQWINPKQRNEGPENWNWEGLKPSDVTLQSVLKQAGYLTMHFGKAHLGPNGKVGADPQKVGFDINVGGNAIGRPKSYYGEKNYGKGSLHAVPHLEAYHGTETFLTEALTIEAKKTLTEVSQKEAPFFMHMSHYAVHGPFDSDPRFRELYADSKSPKKLKAFGTLISGIDKSLGDIIEHLEQIGEAENTLIVFLGDNGSDAPIGDDVLAVESSAPYKGKKGTHYEGGMLAPLIVSWAKPNPESELQKHYSIQPGIVTESFVTICDLMPTILHAAGAKAPEEHVMDGQDISSYFSEHKGNHKQEFLMHFPHLHRSSNYTVLRDGGWKLVKHYGTNAKEPFELFAIQKDPYETKNLADSHAKKREELHEKMQAMLTECKAQYFESE